MTKREMNYNTVSRDEDVPWWQPEKLLGKHDHPRDVQKGFAVPGTPRATARRVAPARIHMTRSTKERDDVHSRPTAKEKEKGKTRTENDPNPRKAKEKAANHADFT